MDGAGVMTMMRPAMGDLDQLVEPLTEAESQVARALARLGEGWTVYIKPRIGLDRPDFLALHDHYGVCAIEVRGWLPHAVRQSDSDGFEFSTESGGWTPSSDQPRFEASRYRLTIYDQFFALPEDGGTTPPEIRAMVVLPYFTTEQAMHLFSRPGVTDEEQLVGVWGSDALELLGERAQGLGSPPPEPQSIRRLREHVVVSERLSVPASEAAPLSASSTELATNPSGLNARRFRGAAGSGKTFGVTARAARLAAEGKKVLLLSFNVTLANRLRELASDRCNEIGANPTQITCANFHTFCTRVVQDAEVAGLHLKAPTGAAWTVAIVAKVEEAFAQGFSRTYDAILIDEGQDFTAEWWQLLRNRVLAPGGEMLIVADPTQDVYGRYEWDVDDSIGGTGLSGPWGELTGSYRMPDDLVGFANEFAATGLEGDVLTMVQAKDHHAVVGNTTAHGSVRRWTNVDRVNDLGRALGLEVVRMLKDNPSLTPGDVTFVCEYHHDGVAAVRVIESAGIPVHHIFSRDPDAPRRRRKHRFWPGVDAVTGCTMHSYKGWETPALALGIGADARARRIGFVSMTRLAALGDGRPSVISVLNADKRLTDHAAPFEAGSKTPSLQTQRSTPTPLAVAPPATPVPFAVPAIHVPPPPAATTPVPPAQSAAAPAPTGDHQAPPISPLSTPAAHMPAPPAPATPAAVQHAAPQRVAPPPPLLEVLPADAPPMAPAMDAPAVEAVPPPPRAAAISGSASTSAEPVLAPAPAPPAMAQPPIPTDSTPAPVSDWTTPDAAPTGPVDWAPAPPEMAPAPVSVDAMPEPASEWTTPESIEAPPAEWVPAPTPEPVAAESWSGDSWSDDAWSNDKQVQQPSHDEDNVWLANDTAAPPFSPTPEPLAAASAPVEMVPAFASPTPAAPGDFGAPAPMAPPPAPLDDMPPPAQSMAPPAPPVDNWSAPVG